MPNNIKQILALGACAFFLACGTSTNERGIAATTADSTASGSAYNSYDGFAPATSSSASAPAQGPAPAASAAVPGKDTTGTPTTNTTTVIVPGATNPTGTTTPAKPGTTVAATKPAPAASDDNADIKRGEALISKSDCLACHQVNVKVLGPSYKDVANKYSASAANIAQLADKIKKGGSGVWGAVPMSPHPALSDDDAKAMVRYILSLK